MKLERKINSQILKRTVLLVLFFLFAKIYGQTVTPQVINSAGGNWQLSNGTTISDNVGEPFITTISNSNNMITQGFLQEFNVGAFFNGTEHHNDVSCKDKNDGNISLAITTNITTYTAQYFWTPQSVCAGNNCSYIDSLKPGTYSVTVKIDYIVNGQLKTDTSNNFVISVLDNNGPCKVKIYTGITPNGDGINDVFAIDNITEFPNNHLLIYNRWGLLLYEEKGYDNVAKVWPKKDDSKLSGSTYFYILYLGDGSEPIKGWIELIKE